MSVSKNAALKALCLSTKEAAELLTLSPRTLEGMRSDGTGPKFIKLGTGPKAKVAYRLGDLHDWVASKVCTPVPKSPQLSSSGWLRLRYR